MNADCFALRFNLHKCGYSVPENAGVFSKMYEVDEAFLKNCLENYEIVNKKSAVGIIGETNFSKYGGEIKGKKILFLGDSITSERMSYGKILEKVLDCCVTDGAISSSRTIDLITVLDRQLYDNKPDIVSVMIGTNDSTFSDKEKRCSFTSAAEYERNINIIIDKIRKTGAEIILNSIPEANYDKFNEINEFWSVSRENNVIFNSILQKAAQRNSLIYNDFRDEMRKHNISLLFEPDAIHPSPYAHRIIAREVLKKLIYLHTKSDI